MTSHDVATSKGANHARKLPKTQRQSSCDKIPAEEIQPKERQRIQHKREVLAKESKAPELLLPSYGQSVVSMCFLPRRSDWLSWFQFATADFMHIAFPSPPTHSPMAFAAVLLPRIVLVCGGCDGN